MNYRGRLAPSPTGHLHLGHALTFWRAQEQARAHSGQLILRIEDIDCARCRPEFQAALIEDLQWFGLEWQEGPDCGGPYGPYAQGARRSFYREALGRLRAGDFIYPCICSRREVADAASAPHPENEEPIYPGTCRGRSAGEGEVHWRFRVPDGEVLEFEDGNFGRQRAVAGQDFGDFLVWRKDGIPAYQLAVVVDDAAMQITEVVRGADLLTSTFRQLLLYRALGVEPPKFHHTSLVTDASGRRLAKREAALSLRALRAAGKSPITLRSKDGLAGLLRGLACSCLCALLLTSCAGPPRVVDARAPVPTVLELQEDCAANTVHFRRGLYLLDSEDARGYYYRAAKGLIQHSFDGAVVAQGGIFVARGRPQELHGYLVWAGGTTRVGDFSRARHRYLGS